MQSYINPPCHSLSLLRNGGFIPYGIKPRNNLFSIHFKKILSPCHYALQALIFQYSFVFYIVTSLSLAVTIEKKVPKSPQIPFGSFFKNLVVFPKNPYFSSFPATPYRSFFSIKYYIFHRNLSIW